MGDKRHRQTPQTVTSDRDQSASGFRKTGYIIILAFIGVLLLGIVVEIAFFPLSQVDPNKPSIVVDAFNVIWNVVYTLILNISAAGITIGAGTVLYGHFDFVQYVKNTLCRVILEHGFVDHLNDSEKDDLMQKLQKHLIYHDTESGNDTLFDFVNTEVRSLTQGPYYENASAIFNCRLEGERIVKHIIRHMEINVQQAPDYRFDLASLTRCYFYGSAESAISDPPFEIINLDINEKNYNNEIECSISDASDERGYGCITEYNFPPDFDPSSLIPDDKIIRIRIEYQTKVPVSDKTLGFRTYFPCKHMDTTFIFNAPLKANADIFCFKDRKPDGKVDRERIQIIKNENCIKINFPDWLLPGDGIIYYIEIENT